MNKLLTLCLATLISSHSVVASAATDTLTVYTYDSFVSKYGPGPKIKAAFEKDCNCEVNFIAAEDGVSILNRLKIEGVKAKADVILGLDNALMFDAKETGLIADHQQDLSALNPILSWTDSQFVPYDYGYFAFIYDSTKITQPATSLRQLVDSDAKVIYQDPRTSTPGQGFMFWMNAVYGDQTNAAWKQLASHTVTVSKGWWEAYSMFLEGGADYVLSYTTSPAYHMIVESESKYKAAQFSEGHVSQIEVAAALNTSSQPELAQAFLKFLISAEAQAILPVTNWMLPVRKDTALPEQFSQLITPKLVDLSIETAVAERKNWIKDWRSSAAK